MSAAPTMTCYRHPDRQTGLSCSECGRPICTDCMTIAPVGIRCPDHSGAKRRLPAPQVVRSEKLGRRALPALLTRILIGLNVAVYLITVAQGGGLNSPGGSLFEKWALWGPFVARGDWWRLITAAFLHGSLLHIGFNMLALWWFGGPVEEYLGRVRFLLLYVVAGLAGSAGALIANPLAVTVGASGAIFGILGAMAVIEWQHTGRLAGNAVTLIVVNLALNFVIPNVSIGGHLGGLAGGLLGMLAFARFGRGHAAYGKVGMIGFAGLVAIGAASIAISYWKVRGYA